MTEDKQLKPGRKPGSGVKERLTVTVDRDTLDDLRGRQLNISGLVNDLLNDWRDAQSDTNVAESDT